MGRDWWAQYLIFVNIRTSRIDPGHIKRLPSTCEKVGQHAQKTVIHAHINFPSSRTCKPKSNRAKRAWYDTLMAGYGTITGTLNGFDIETLANGMHNAGQGVKDAITLQARWMPTIFHPARISAGVDSMMLNLLKAGNNFALGFDTNVAKFVNWTVCTLQTIYEQQQKTNAMTSLMTGNEQIWRRIFDKSISESSWIHLKAQKMTCNDTDCFGIITIYNVTKSTIMCKYVVMPLIIGLSDEQYFWNPVFYGSHIDIFNQTHDLTLCQDTLQGKICKLQSNTYEPCLLQNTVSVCEWNILPITYDYMIEIAPQVICVVTNTPVISGMKCDLGDRYRGLAPWVSKLSSNNTVCSQSKVFMCKISEEKSLVVTYLQADRWRPDSANTSEVLN
ncbi:uncharacterized protein ACMZJ9_003461 [Mantella aurantiaca]